MRIGLIEEGGGLANFTGDALNRLAGTFHAAREAGWALTPEMDRLADSFEKNTEKADTFSGTLRRAFEGGGDFIGGIKSWTSKAVSSSFADAESGIGKFFGGKLPGMMGGFGEIAGGALSGGISIAVQVGLELLTKWISSWWDRTGKRIRAMAESYNDSMSSIISGTMSAADAFRKALVDSHQDEELSASFERLLELEEVYKNAGKSAQDAARWQREWNKAVKDHDANKLYSLTRELELVSKIAREQEEELKILEERRDTLQDIIDAETKVVN